MARLARMTDCKSSSELISESRGVDVVGRLEFFRRDSELEDSLWIETDEGLCSSSGRRIVSDKVFMEDCRCEIEDWKACACCSSEARRVNGSLNSLPGLGRRATIR